MRDVRMLLAALLTPGLVVAVATAAVWLVARG